jgi:hypothetical protein
MPEASLEAVQVSVYHKVHSETQARNPISLPAYPVNNFAFFAKFILQFQI